MYNTLGQERMQADSLNAYAQNIGPLPVLCSYWQRLELHNLLQRALPAGAAQAIQRLLKSILLRPSALYRIQEWSQQWDPRWMGEEVIGDDAIGRALDRLFQADRASLLTLVVLQAIEAFDLKLDQIHNYSTTVSFAGAYRSQKPQALQL